MYICVKMSIRSKKLVSVLPTIWEINELCKRKYDDIMWGSGKKVKVDVLEIESESEIEVSTEVFDMSEYVNM